LSGGASVMTEETVVITGGGGFVGRHLIAELKREGAGRRIIVWDPETRSLPDGVEGLSVDITDVASYEDSLRMAQPAWIVHLAAVSSASLAAEDTARAHLVNVVGTRQLLERAKHLSPGTQMLAISSADIYGQGSSTPLAELPLEQALPSNPYAFSKLEMEKVIEQHFNERVIRVRPFPHIGPGQALGYVTADFASQIAAIEGDKQEPIIKVGNLEAQRDFTDVRDVVRAYRLLMERGTPGEVYHVASGVAVSIQSILDMLLSLSSVSVTVEQDPDRLRPSDIPVLVGDASKLKRLTGWQTTISLEQSLRDVLDAWRSVAA